MQYATDYGHNGYAGRRSQIEEDEQPWVPENYLEKGAWNFRRFDKNNKEIIGSGRAPVYNSSYSWCVLA